MKNSRIFILLFLALFGLLGCAMVETVDPQLRRKAASIKILSEDPGSENREIIGEVLGVSCGRQLGSDPSVDAAREKMRIDAAKLNATSVINVMCEESGVDLMNNCWKTIQCRGDAIK